MVQALVHWHKNDHHGSPVDLNEGKGFCAEFTGFGRKRASIAKNNALISNFECKYTYL